MTTTRHGTDDDDLLCKIIQNEYIENLKVMFFTDKNVLSRIIPLRLQNSIQVRHSERFTGDKKFFH